MSEQQPASPRITVEAGDKPLVISFLGSGMHCYRPAVTVPAGQACTVATGGLFCLIGPEPHCKGCAPGLCFPDTG